MTEISFSACLHHAAANNSSTKRVQRRLAGHLRLSIMWAIAQRVRRRLSKRERRFSEPTIQVTENAAFTTSGPTTVADSHRSMPLLFNLCRRWAWPAIEWRCQSHPHEANAQDVNGDTGLHWAAFGRPPIGAIQALIDACPGLATKRNRKGQLPIQSTYKICSRRCDKRQSTCRSHIHITPVCKQSPFPIELEVT